MCSDHDGRVMQKEQTDAQTLVLPNAQAMLMTTQRY